MSNDKVLLAIASNMFCSIANEMGTVMLLSAYSSIAREAKDVSTCIFDPQGRVVAQSIMIPMHMNSLAMAVKGWQAKYDFAQTAEDELYVMNHPYHFGQHLNDIIMLMPIFHAGQLCGFAGSVCHHVDIGGDSVMNAHATQLRQEGLIIPPIKVKQDAAIDGGILEQLLAANVRVPTIVVGDFRAQYFACHRGCSLLSSMAARYGNKALLGWMSDLQDYAERAMRHSISKIPDGTYYGEDFCDPLTVDGEPIPLRVTITVSGNAAFVDLSASSDQVPGPINSPVASAYSAVYTLFVSLMRSDTLVNDGSYRPISIKTRLGSICDPIPLAPVRTRMTSSYRVFSACRNALADVVPDRVAAAGHDATTSVAFAYSRDGKQHVFQEVIGGGLGGSRHGPGSDGIAQPLSNTGNTPVEVVENEADFLRVLSYGLITGSGGEGVHPGGMGIRKVFVVTSDGVTFSSTGDRCRIAPLGTNGGGSGRKASVSLKRHGKKKRLSAHNTEPAKKGDIYTIETAGGGGWRSV